MNSSLNTQKFLISSLDRKGIGKWPTRLSLPEFSEEELTQKMAHHTQQIGELQEKLYAQNQHSLLLIFQGMDTAGKDGTIKHVFSGINPQGCQVTSFKQPSHIELQHDFLWRCQQALPLRGHIGIFNRSYYEELLVVRVHQELLQEELLPRKALRSPKIWEQRFADVGHYEKYLRHQGTIVIKFFLHISKEEQRLRFLSRLEDPKKHWKFEAGDIHERKYWRDYQKAYEKCLTQTSTAHAPWYAIPADDKKTAHFLVSKIVMETLEELDLQYPKVSARQERALAQIHKQLKSKKS